MKVQFKFMIDKKLKDKMECRAHRLHYTMTGFVNMAIEEKLRGQYAKGISADSLQRKNSKAGH